MEPTAPNSKGKLSVSVDNVEHIDDDVHSVELRSFPPATCVSKIWGCCPCFLLVLAAMGGFGYMIYLNPVCLSFNFTDFKVINSEISDEYYQHTLSEASSYSEVIDLDGSRRRRRLAARSEAKYRRRLSGNDSDSESDNYVNGYYMGWTSSHWQRRAVAREYLNVFFYSKKSQNILTNDLLEICHEVEVGIKAFGGYSNHALLYREKDDAVIAAFGSTESALYLEAAPGSFLNYVYPQTIAGQYVFNGNGDDLTLQGDIEETIRLYSDYEDLTEYFDYGFDFINVSSKYLAAVYPFSYKASNESSDELGEWLASYKEQYFDKLPSSITSKVGIAVQDSNNMILNEELYDYLYEDLQLAGWSLLMIFLVVYLYCRSLYITFLGLLGVCLSFVPCFAIYERLWGQSFNLVNMVSLWVILGIGCDDICVFMSSYRRAPLESVDGTVIPNHLRMAFAYREAGAAMFVTSFTTACSFFSLCLSTINPLPQFGWFLGALVLTNFVMVMTWFPCVLQSYVWFVMLTMKCKCHIEACNRWLAVAVPLPSAHATVSRADSVKVLRRSSHAMTPSQQARRSPSQHMTPVPDYENDINHQFANSSSMIYGQRRESMQFVVPGSRDITRQNSQSRKLVRTLTEKLDKNSKAGSGGFEAETSFGDLTTLYFLIMRRGLGVTLLGIVAVVTCVFAYTMTNVSIAEDTTKLLPDYTNWGQVNLAVESMDIDEESFSGWSPSTQESTGAIVVSGTKNPTKAPVYPSPSRQPTAATLSPTLSPTQPPILPTTPGPTLYPTLPSPTASPTTGSPTTVGPTPNPITVSPTSGPTLSPSPVPTTPTTEPTDSPTGDPTKAPSPLPTPQPTDHPIQPADPTAAPTGTTASPSDEPSSSPTTFAPTEQPTVSPSDTPSVSPTTFAPTTNAPTTDEPTTNAPTIAAPTQDPTLSPSTESPTTALPTTESPTMSPTNPSTEPTVDPTQQPTPSPTFSLPVDPVYSCYNEVASLSFSMPRSLVTNHDPNCVASNKGHHLRANKNG